MPPETTSPACCVACTKYDEDTRHCTAPGGKLAGIPLTEALAEATHDCPEFDEVRYRLSPAAILSSTLTEYGYDLPFDEVKEIFDDFMERMERAGYIEKHEEE